MSPIYRSIWDEAQQSTGFALKALTACVMAAFGSIAHAGPTGGTVAAGSASIANSASTTTITQTTQNAVINWQSFSIGQGEAVRFVQPNSSSVALNRVLGAEPSSILGSLSANGKVFLVNPNGILFGPGSSVNVGALVASTLNIADADFMAGRYKFNNPGSGSVVNQGSINADGGYVALLGATVSNQGTISARLGTVALAAGNAITLDVAGDGLLNVTIDEGAVNALVSNGGLIKADGGQVLLSAQAAGNLLKTVVNNDGVIEAQTIDSHNGVIRLLGDMQSGTVNAGGTLDAAAPNGGNGGFIETSAASVKIANDIRVTTAAPGGLTGSWLVDPTDFTISAGSAALTTSGIGATTLQNSLATTNVSIATSSAANGSELGDIHVNSAVSWSANKLTLTAHNDININAVMTASGTASLDLEPGSTNVNVALGGSGFTGRVDFSGSGVLTINNHVYTVIQDVNALQAMNSNLGGYYALGSNIDASATSGWNGGAGFQRIGPATSYGDTGNAFSGTFDGLGHTISDLTINRPSTHYVGLFGYVNPTAVMRNVGLTGGSMRGNQLVGSLVGFNFGAVSNSFATSAVTGSDFVGGLVGYNGQGVSTIRNSYATGAVVGRTEVGGLVGTNYAGLVADSYATGTVTGTQGWGTRAGGLVGLNSSSIIRNSYSTGAVSGAGGAGGLVGEVIGTSTVDNSFYNLDAVTVNGAKPIAAYGIYNSLFGEWLGNGRTLDIASHYTADGSGYYQIGTLQDLKNLLAFGGNSAYRFRLSADLDLASIAGFYIPNFSAAAFDGAGHTLNNFSLNLPSGGNVAFIGALAAGSTVTNLGMTNVSVTGGGNVAALAGDNRGTISASYATGTVTGGGTVGALVGYNGGTVSNSYASATVSGADNSGGLVGNNGGTISASYASGAVSGSGNGHGGLAGVNSGTIGGSSYATGSVSGTDRVGGLVGQNTGVLGNSYATGNVTGGNSIGGLVGQNTGSVTGSYASGAVSGVNYIGGFAGENIGGQGNSAFGSGTGTAGGSASITDSYATGSATGTSYVGGFAGRNAGGNGGSGFFGGTGGTGGAATIAKSYSTGLVTGASQAGGLVGGNVAGTAGSSGFGGGTGGAGGAASVSASFWDSATSGQASSAAGAGMSTTAMKTQANFTGATAANGSVNPAWDMTSTWFLDADAYPKLRALTAPAVVTTNNAPSAETFAPATGVRDAIADTHPRNSLRVAEGHAAHQRLPSGLVESLNGLNLTVVRHGVRMPLEVEAAAADLQEPEKSRRP